MHVRHYFFEGYGGAGAPPAAGVAARPMGFAPLVPAPDVGFWQELMRHKMDVQRLDSSPIPVSGYYEGRAAAGAPAKCFLLRESFSASPSFQPGSALLRGEIQNFNTVEEFKAFLGSGQRAARVALVAQALRDDIVSGDAVKDPAKLRPLLIVSFADLKKYHFAYTVALPVLAPTVAWMAYAPACSAQDAGIDRELLCRVSRDLVGDPVLARAGVFLLTRASAGEWSLRGLEALLQPDCPSGEDLFVGFVDPSAADDAPGWPLRNLVLALAHHRREPQ